MVAWTGFGTETSILLEFNIKDTETPCSVLKCIVTQKKQESHVLPRSSLLSQWREQMVPSIRTEMRKALDRWTNLTLREESGRISSKENRGLSRAANSHRVGPGARPWIYIQFWVSMERSQGQGTPMGAQPKAGQQEGISNSLKRKFTLQLGK